MKAHEARQGAMHILVVTGASGVGKTTAVRALDARNLPGVRCFFLDSIGVPSAEVMQREHGGGEQWQLWATRRWLQQLDQLDDSVRIAVLDGQTRPSFVGSAAESLARRVHTVLLDCAHGERDERLRIGRGQPELATREMAMWAAYLRGQADALGLEIIDTTALSADAVADRLCATVERLIVEV